MIGPTLNLTRSQACALGDALRSIELIHLGRIDEVADLIAEGILPAVSPAGDSAHLVPAGDYDVSFIRETLVITKVNLGYPEDAHLGIMHPDVQVETRLIWQVSKVLSAGQAGRLNRLKLPLTQAGATAVEKAASAYTTMMAGGLNVALGSIAKSAMRRWPDNTSRARPLSEQEIYDVQITAKEIAERLGYWESRPVQKSEMLTALGPAILRVHAVAQALRESLGRSVEAIPPGLPADEPLPSCGKD